MFKICYNNNIILVRVPLEPVMGGRPFCKRKQEFGCASVCIVYFLLFVFIVSILIFKLFILLAFSPQGRVNVSLSIFKQGAL